MNRYKRTQTLIEGDQNLAYAIAEEVEKDLAVEILDAPHDELVMVRVRESARNSLFYLGEALMCSCRVRVGDAIGYGMVFGSKEHQNNLVYSLAVVDAIWNASEQHPSKKTWTSHIESASHALQEKRAYEAARIKKTRVDFSTMEVDV